MRSWNFEGSFFFCLMSTFFAWTRSGTTLTGWCFCVCWSFQVNVCVLCIFTTLITVLIDTIIQNIDLWYERDVDFYQKQREGRTSGSNK